MERLFFKSEMCSSGQNHRDVILYILAHQHRKTHGIDKSDSKVENELVNTSNL